MPPANGLAVALILAPIGAFALGLALRGVHNGPTKVTNGLLWTATVTLLGATLTAVGAGWGSAAVPSLVLAALAALALYFSPKIARRHARRDAAYRAAPTAGDAVADTWRLMHEHKMPLPKAAKRLADQLGVSTDEARILLEFDPDERIAAK